jgi:glyoxalase family protein
MKPLYGIHHVTAITSSAEKIYDFFTHILGLRLVKKTINQDDISTYHLFFADDVGSAGTDMTFFDFKGSSQAQKGTDEIAKTGFRVPSNQAITYFKKRFEKYQVKHDEPKTLFGILTMSFEDFDGQEYVLYSDEFDHGVKAGIPWLKGPIPNEYAIVGLGPIWFRVSNPDFMERVLSQKLTFSKTDTEGLLSRYQTGIGGNGASIIVETRKDLARGIQGFGGIHHIAFAVDDKYDLDEWIQSLNQQGIRHSGHVDRFYFKSLYTRIYPSMLFEFATMGPGFIDDEEPYETLGELLALPPKFRSKRNEIEKLVRHIDTKRSDKVYNKEYM